MWLPRKRNILKPRDKLWLPPLGSIWTPYSRAMGRRRCCCGGGPNCTIFADQFNVDGSDPGANWDVQAGTCSVSSGYALPSANSRVICNTAHPDGDLTGVVTVSVDPSLMNANDTVLLWVSFAGTGSTFSAEFKLANSGGSGGTVKIYENGVQVDSATQNTFKVGGGSALMSLCFSGVAIFARVAGGPLNQVANATAGSVGYGDQAGFGAGTVSGTTKINSFVFYKYGDGSNDCPFCLGECRNTCIAEAPPRIKIEWANAISADDACTSCDGADSGTAYIDFYIYFEGFSGSFCNYGYAFLPVSLFPNCQDQFTPGYADCRAGATGWPTVPPAGSSTFTWYGYFSNAGPVSGHYYLFLQFGIACTLRDPATSGATSCGDDDSSMLFYYDLGTSKPDCNALGGPLTMTYDSTYYENGATPCTACIWNDGATTVEATVIAG